MLQRLPAHPRTLMLALMKADDETFDPIWALSRHMPFLWMLFSIHDWREAAAAYFGGLQAALAEIDEGEEIVFGLFQQFRERTAARRIYWRSLCDWLQERLFPDRPPPNGELNIARCCPAFLEQQIESLEQALQGRHDAEEKWPEHFKIIGYLSAIDSKHRYLHLNPAYRPVRCGPFVAAHLSLNRVAPTESLIYELRLLRAFDREWFDHVYAIALTLGLAHRSLES